MSRQVNLGQIIPNIQVGETITGNAGTQANVENTGTDLNPILNFTIPKGDTGSQGPQGVAGKDAKINGVNTLSIEAGTNITLDQEGNILTINSTGGGASDYADLTNKPKINNVELVGNKSLNDLGIQPAGNYALESDMTDAQNDIEALQTENERLKATLPTTTGEGQDITLNKTAEMEFVKPPLPRGNTKQETTIGYNLLGGFEYEQSSGGVTFKYDDSGTIAINGTPTSNTDSMNSSRAVTNGFTRRLETGTYTLNGISTGTGLLLGIVTNESGVWAVKTTTLNEVKSFSIVNDCDYFFRAQVNSGVTYSTVLYPILVKGSYTSETMPEYEPYTGGIPSPNPDYPQEIYSVGDNVNLFDKTTITENARFTPDGTIYRDTNYFATDYIPVKVNTRYTANSNFLNSYNRICYYDDNKVFISANDGNDINYFITPTGTKFVRFSKANNQLNTLKLVEGKNIGEYSAYGMGCSTVKIVNKNLFNPNTALIKKYVMKSSGGIATSPNWSASDFIQVKPDTQYIYSGVTNRLSDVAGTAFYDETKTFISSVSSTTQTFTTPSNAKYVRISVQTETPNKIQLEQGSTATEYVAYQEQTFTFPLGNEKLMLGDYLADDGIHHLRKRIVLNGSENWNYNVQNNVAYLQLLTKVSSRKGLFSNLFSYYNGDWTTAPNNTISEATSSNFIFIKSTVASDNPTWKSWLSTNNVTIEYELVNEEITPYTTEQQQVYNLIKKALSYEGQTNITSDTIALFDVEAYQSTKLILENLDSRLTLVEG